MLFKAILTGGVLSVLAGSMVYFGTEGADALTRDVDVESLIDQSELAGAADVEIGPEKIIEKRAGVAVQDPPRETSKPKTKWLDQYLKKSNTEAETDSDDQDEAMDLMDVTQDEGKTGKQIRIIKRFEDDNSSASVTGSYVVSEENQAETQDPETVEIDVFDGIDFDMIDLGALDLEGDIDIEVLKERLRVNAMGSEGIDPVEGVETEVLLEPFDINSIDLDSVDLEGLFLDGDVDVDVLKKQLGLGDEENVKIRVIKKVETTDTQPNSEKKVRKIIDYDAVLLEAKKLLVTDMKNQAVLEIVDYAVDNGDMGQAADLVEELSTPELRDTARARIGTGLARRGKTEAAFAVLERIEIDELSAPIRLEIITALMATKQERKALNVIR